MNLKYFVFLNLRNLFLVLKCGMSTLFGSVDSSIIPQMDTIYDYNFKGKVNSAQKCQIETAKKLKCQKLRVMTYNMLYNEPAAEKKLKPENRWDQRQPRLYEYLRWAKADIIGSQELQEDQVYDVMQAIGNEYDYYGLKTRETENRTDINAIFFNKDRFCLLEASMHPYPHPQFTNAFTFCVLHDNFQNQDVAVINTKLTYSDPERRLQEATQIHDFVSCLEKDVPVIVLGDFNSFPFFQHYGNLFFDGDSLVRIVEGSCLKDAKSQSIFGHFGPLCSINNAKDNLEPFVGPQLHGFILDHIFVSGNITVLTHGIDTARVNGHFPSDHFPVIADIAF